MDACWSPVRPSVFFTVKMDGMLDVWDILSKQNEPMLRREVCSLCSYCTKEFHLVSVMCHNFNTQNKIKPLLLLLSGVQ